MQAEQHTQGGQRAERPKPDPPARLAVRLDSSFRFGTAIGAYGFSGARSLATRTPRRSRDEVAAAAIHLSPGANRAAEANERKDERLKVHEMRFLLERHESLQQFTRSGR